MPLDPEFTATIARMTDSGALPLVRGTAQETREHHRSLVLARRGPDFVPEAVTSVVDATVPGPTGPLAVRTYSPDDAHAVVLFLHGGGWVMGDLDTHDPAPLDDAWATLQELAIRHPGRPLAVAGDSAGGSLAAGLAVHSRAAGGPALAAQLLVYPPTDPSMARDSVRRNGEGHFLTAADMEWFYRQYAPDPEQAGDPRVDLLAAPDLAGLPPAVVATAEFCPLHDEGVAYAERLRAAGVPVTLVPGPGLIHGYFAFLGAVPAADARSREVLDAFAALLS